jgi:hypothetical protein
MSAIYIEFNLTVSCATADKGGFYNINDMDKFQTNESN